MDMAHKIGMFVPAPAVPHGLKALTAAATLALLSACAGQETAPVSTTKASELATAATTAVQAATLSDGEVKDLSDKSCAAVDAKSKIAAPRSKEAQRLAKIVKGMPTSVNDVPINYKVYLTKDVNAWAMNNGCVRVYSGLMSLMSDAEVRGVIGHEIGHVALGHAKAAMQTAYTASAVRQAAAASGNQAAEAISNSQLGEITEKLINAQFSQTQESAADDYAFDLLKTAKFKLSPLATAFEKLAKLGDDSSMFSSHPSSSERAQHIRERIAAQSKK